jgi:predicted nucleic acid-binding protein
MGPVTGARAIQSIAERYGLSVWDSMIAASAVLAGCSTLLTEDMQYGQAIEDRLRIRNPFL